jgi:DNA replication protein DnaC
VEYALNLAGMAHAFAEQREQPTTYGPLSFEDRFGLLVDREATERENRRLERYLRAAKLRLSAAIEDVDFRASREASTAACSSISPLRAGWPRTSRS